MQNSIIALQLSRLTTFVSISTTYKNLGLLGSDSDSLRPFDNFNTHPHLLVGFSCSVNNSIPSTRQKPVIIPSHYYLHYEIQPSSTLHHCLRHDYSNPIYGIPQAF